MEDKKWLFINAEDVFGVTTSVQIFYTVSSQGASTKKKYNNKLLYLKNQQSFLKQEQLVMIKEKEGKSMCPRKPRKPCNFRGCPELTDDRYCAKHNKLFNNERESAAGRGYDSKWRVARKRYLSNNLLCIYCLKNNKMVKATVVDHIVPHRGDKILFWDQNNWQPLCKKCHDKKTMTEDRYQEYSFENGHF